MLMEHLILVAMWLFGLVAFVLFTPRKDLRKGFLAILMFQTINWLSDMFSYKYGWIRAPVREFPKATDLPLTIDYFFYSVLFSIFYVHSKAKGSLWARFIYFFIWISIITLFDSSIETYTDLLEYESLEWYGMWIYMGFLFYFSQICCNWFFKDKSLFQAERMKAYEN